MTRSLLKLRALIHWLNSLNIPLHAANTGYFLVLAVFPALLLVLTGLRYTGFAVEELLGLLEGFLPAALMPTAQELIGNVWRSASGTVAGVSALAAIWSSSKGIYGLLTGLNAVYGVSEDRGYFYTRGISVLYTVLFQIMMLLTLVLHVFGNWLLGLLHRSSQPGIMLLAGILDLRFFFLLLMQTLLFTAMFMFLPNRRNRFWESLPGGLLASIGWMVYSNVYSVYVTHFPRYANIYGSVYAIAISMLWLYFCISILFLGGALNRLLMRKDVQIRPHKY